MPPWIWLAYLGLLGVLVAIDQGMFRRRARVVGPGEGAASTTLWVLAALGTGLLLARGYHGHWFGLGETLGTRLSGHEVWLQFVASYCTEIALSLDNIALFALLFTHLGVRAATRQRVLFWTIIACLATRAVLIAVGVELLAYEWTRAMFAALLLVGALRTLVMPDRPGKFEQDWLVRGARRLAARFFPDRVRGSRIRLGLPTIVVVAVAADLSFNAESIPAVFAITRDPIVALTANTLALLALRSLFVAISGAISSFRFLKLAVTALLLILFAKTVVGRFDDQATVALLGAVCVVVGGALAWSIRRARRAAPSPRPTPLEDLAEAAMATRRNLRKVFILMGGTTIIVLAVVIAPLPGPGFLVLAPVGVAVLATEFVWARRLQGQLKDQATRLQRQADAIALRTNPMVVPLVLALYGGAFALVWRETDLPRSVLAATCVGGLMPLGYWALRTLRRPKPPGAAGPERDSRGDRSGSEGQGPPSGDESAGRG